MKKGILFCLVTFCLLSFACSSEKRENAKEMKGETTSQVVSQTQNKSKWQAPKQASVDPAKKYIATIKTTRGEITVELFPKDAPLSVTNFVELIKKGFYKGMTFHRVVPDFVIQTGDPTGTGMGGVGYTLPSEINLTHKEGALAWARLPDADSTGKLINPKKESSGSQFYITLAPQPSLDGQYTVFGQTIRGLEVAQSIKQGDVIQDIRIEVQ